MRFLGMAGAVVILLMPPHSARGGEEPAAEADRLKKEAVEILEKNRGRLEPEPFRQAIAKLVQARELLDGLYTQDAKRWDKPLTDLEALLFWARKTAPIAVVDSTPILPSKQPAPASAGTEEAARRAQQALEAALAYERTNPDDHFNAALRFFRVSEENPGTDEARVAFQKATWHQKQAEAAKTTGPATAAAPDEADKLVQKAGVQLNQEAFEKAAQLAQQAIDIRSVAEAFRILGYARFGQGEELRKQYAKQYLAARDRYNRAKDRNDSRGMNAALAELGKINQTVPALRTKYEESRKAFEKAIEKAGGQDLESELQIALSLSYDIKNREALQKARGMFEGILKKHAAGSMTDQTLLAKARSQLEIVKKLLGG